MMEATFGRPPLGFPAHHVLLWALAAILIGFLLGIVKYFVFRRYTRDVAATALRVGCLTIVVGEVTLAFLWWFIAAEFDRAPRVGLGILLEPPFIGYGVFRGFQVMGALEARFWKRRRNGDPLPMPDVAA